MQEPEESRPQSEELFAQVEAVLQTSERLMAEVLEASRKLAELRREIRISKSPKSLNPPDSE